MANSLFDCLTKNNPKDCAVVLCDNENVLDFKNYEEIIAVTKELIVQFKTFFTSPSECVGLLMQQNVYLPAIMASLQTLNQAFTFIGINNLHETNNALHINWILSFENIDLKDIKEVHRIYLKVEKYIIISKKLNYKYSSDMEKIFIVVQTSGTTGKKKIVKVPYSCIESNILSLSNIFNITSRDILFWGTPLSFDPSLIECLLGIFNGACLLIVPYKIYLNPYAMYEALFRVKHINFLQIVPSVFLRWSENLQKDILQNENLRILSFGGETFPSSILEFEKSESLKLYNLYGITEISCWATIHEVTELINNDIPIGKCLADTILEVRNDDGECIQNGEGEIFIGSCSRICYIDDETENILQNPHFRATGDIAKINDKGIFYKYRKDQIIKRFGHRVDLFQIENTIVKQCGLTNKCIFSQKLNKLLCFIVMPENFNKMFCEKTIDKIRVKLMSVVSQESYPDHFDFLRKIPLTHHGKVDTSRLEEFYLQSVSKKCSWDNDALFSELFCKYLGFNVETLKTVENCTFLELGGTSIGALQLATELKDILKYKCPDNILSIILDNNFDECKLSLINYKKRLREDNTNEDVKKIKLNDSFKFLWSCNLKACVDTSPLVFNKDDEYYIAIGSFSGMFVVLNCSGQELYKNIFPDSIQSTPVISKCGNFIFIGCLDGSMYCIDFLRNMIIWKFSTRGPIISSPCFCKSDMAMVFGSYDKNVYCLLIKDACLQWQREIDGSISARPVFDYNNQRIFIFSTLGSCFCLQEGTGHIIFKLVLGEPIFGTPCLLNSHEIVIPTVKNNLICRSTENKNINWKFCVAGPIYSSVIVFENYIVFGCHDKHIYIVKPSSKDCNLIGKLELDSQISSSVFVFKTSNNVTIIIAASNSGNVYIIDFYRLFIMHVFKLPDQTFSSPTVSNGKLFIGCRDNNLYCIDLEEVMKV